MKRWLLLLPIFILPLLVRAQMFTTVFWQQAVGLVSLGSFSVTGVTGTTDSTADAWLVNDTDPIVNFGASTSATDYDIVIKDLADTTTVCFVSGATTTSVSLSSCGLTNGSSYHVHVTAKSGATTRTASNDGFSLTVDRTTPTANTITGLTGGTDSTADIWLVGVLNPTVNWSSFTGAFSYDVTIKDSAGSSTVCATQNSSGGSFNFSSCNLTSGTSYKAYVKAKSASGFNTINASNDGYLFSVDNTAPGAFAITGITGGTDSTVDAYLANGTSPTVNFGSSANVYRYDVIIKDSAGTTTVCSSLDQTASPVAVSCSLVSGQTYKAFVQAKSISTYLKTNSSNDGYSFTVGTPPSSSPANFSITGATGGTDTIADNWLTNGTTVTASWRAAAGAQSYSVTIRNSADSADVCATQTTASTSYTFTGCTLVAGTAYKIKVAANNPPATATSALNNGFAFQVNSPAHGSFTISGATGGTDAIADMYLLSGNIVTANWAASTGATSYDVTVLDAAGSTTVCSTQNVTSATTATFTGCTLTAGTTYSLQVIAKSGSLTTTAENSPFAFLVPGTITFCPGALSTNAKASFFQSSLFGSNPGYNNNENCSLAISPPGTPGITVKFTNFSSQDVGDTMKIYDSNAVCSGSCFLNSPNGYRNGTSAPDQSASSGNMFLSWVTGATGQSTGFKGYYISTFVTPFSFTISGVKGGSDTTNDAYLTDGSANPTVTWSASSYASSYNVVIRNSTNTNDICARANTTSTSYSFTGCNLMAGAVYSVVVFAKGADGTVTQASNSPYAFTYESRPLTFSITGVSGGTDSSLDDYLEDGTTATINWSASTNQTSYSITIYESDGYTVKCASTSASSAATSQTFSSCALISGATYKAEVLATNANGTVAASNSPLTFKVKVAWTPTTASLAPDARIGHSAVWTGSEMIIWGGGYLNTGGRYNPTTDSWIATSTLANTPIGRSGHAAVWSGTEMILWGGTTSGGTLTSGGRYNPSSDSWILDAGLFVVDSREYATAVWTGSEMIVWGGGPGLNTGGRYNPTTDSWMQISSGANNPAARLHHTAVWTGSEMIIWGGQTTVNNATILNTGGRYNPSTDTWIPVSVGANVPSIRTLHTAVWTGTEMIVWGGISSSSVNTGGRYNPSTDSWLATSTGTNVPVARNSHVAVWTGSEMIIWGGVFLNSGGRYNPTSDSWLPTSVGTNVPSGRCYEPAIWTGTEMIVWGGNTASGGSPTNTGGRYNPSTDSWLATSVGTNLPPARYSHSGVWTGTEMIIWGGYGVGGGGGIATGGRYNPATDSWLTTSSLNAPPGRLDHVSIWTGNEMIIWGGTNGSTTSLASARYVPSSDSWISMNASAPNVPALRIAFTSVWTGTEMIIWGGSSSGTYVNTGGRYKPSTGTWALTSTGTNVPVARASIASIWTGSEMIVWGGADSLGNSLNTGGRYNPVSDSWLATSVGANVPVGRSAPRMVWTGTEMLLWGGQTSTFSFTNTGGRYKPSSDTWIPVSTGLNVPSARGSHTIVWTGSEAIVWGGYIDSNSTSVNSGGRYFLSTDTWILTPSQGNAPSARNGHTAVWTGTQMIIWGGSPGLSGVLGNGASFSP